MNLDQAIAAADLRQQCALLSSGLHNSMFTYLVCLHISDHGDG